jgi:hypothetical protein
MPARDAQLLAEKARAIVNEANLGELDQIDDISYRLIVALGSLAAQIADRPTRNYDEEIVIGQAFVRAMYICWQLSDRLESFVIEKPPDRAPAPVVPLKIAERTAS